MAEMVDSCTTTTTVSQTELGWTEDLGTNQHSSMELVPYTPPPLYGPFLPQGLEAGNSLEGFQASSTLPAAFMANDDDSTAVKGSDTKDPNAVRGMCGLRNMGNTCFMNSGLQCLIHHPRLALHLLDHEALPEEGMAYHFAELLQKTWSGDFSVLHPGSFKDTMGFIHPQFKDFRQHDGQEFLALLLDTLHEELNQAKRPAKGHSPATDYSEESSDSHYASEASTSKLSELEALDIDSGKEETPSSHQNNRRDKMQVDEEEEAESSVSSQTAGHGEGDVSREADGSGEERRRSGEDGGEAAKLPSIEEFYMKDVKILNTNMLQGEEISPSVSDSSDKFPKKEKAPILSSIRNLMDLPSDSSVRSVGKPKKSNVLAAKKSKANLRTEANNQEKSAKESGEVSSDEPDPIKRMKMDLNPDQIAKLYESTCKETNGLSPMKFHDYVTSCTLDDPKSVNIFAEKMTNKLAELEGPADSTTSIKPQVMFHKYEPETLEPETHSRKQFMFDNEKILASPRVDTLDKASLDGKLGRGGFLPNNQQYLVKEDLEDRMKVDSTFEEKCRRREDREGEEEWDRHLRNNRSVVVDTFQGQFKSTVVCAVCGHVSIMFEPFMYLSVPLPRAMDQQLIVTVISSQGLLPTRHLVTLNRFDSVRELRLSLKAIVSGLSKEDDKDIIVAEVLDHHVSKFLEDGIQLRYVNDCYRLLYAFEVNANAREQLYSSLCPEQGESGQCGNSQSNFDLYLNDHSNMSSQSDDVITHMGDATAPSLDPVTSSWDIEVTTTSAGDTFSAIGVDQPSDITSTSGLDQGYGGEGRPYSGDVFSHISYFDASESSNTNEHEGILEGTPADSTAEPSTNRSSSMQVMQGSSSGIELWAGSQADSVPWVTNEPPSESAPANSPAAAMPSWKSCAICLEELPPHQLLTHAPCGGVLCAICMERAVKHYGDQAVSCPVCRQEIDPMTDYVAMAAGASAPNMMKRVLLLSVTFRNDLEEDGVVKSDLFGHPRVLYTLNEVSGEELFCQVESLMPVRAPFSLVLTDSQGFSCSRCSFELHCRGCQLVREVDITLSSDDHLTVVYHNLHHALVESAGRVCDNQSVGDFIGNDPITLRDCFQAFSQSETLDEHNPWFCPKCKKPQRASKTISVCRFPDTLIVYLKRFVFHQAMSTKLDNKVLFPIEDIDVRDYMNVSDIDEELVYDLQSAVCHFGGVNAGHYTSFVKNPWTGQWQYCNDETILQQEPTEQDTASVYILFYTRKGSHQDFTLPPSSSGLSKTGDVSGTKQAPAVCSSSSSSSSSTTSSSAALSPPQTRMEEPSLAEEQHQDMMEATDLDRFVEDLGKEEARSIEVGVAGSSCEAEGQESAMVMEADGSL
ncbi:uncharacterized protein [Diadema antillarum]|uniref:uncharacterized protein n=1 Tax=Diadema antillarum TaxID=105358 RepID=UPI003A839348